MICEEISSKLDLYLDQVLAADEQAKFEDHLKICSTCAKEVRSLQKLEALARMEILSSPPEEYWQRLPKIIIQRLGLVPAKSIPDRARQKVAFMSRFSRIRWGLAVGALAVLLLFVGKQFILEKPANPGRSAGQQAARSASSQTFAEEKTPAISSPAKDLPAQPIVAESLTPPTKKAARGGQGSATTLGKSRRLETPEKAASAMVRSAYSVRLRVAALAPRALPQRQLRSPNELFPVPQTEFASEEQTLVAEKKEKVRNRVPDRFALNVKHGGEQPPPLTRPDLTEETHEAESDYAEVLWFVQQSTSLSEKRNIWLSYIEREQDPTYRSLGIYHLALVLSKEVEESRDPEKAREALRFYLEHQKALRFQMGAPRYRMKIEIFKRIIRRK